MTKKPRHLNIVLPCAGSPNKIKTIGPKSLIMVGGESLLNRQLRILNDTFVNHDIYVVIGFDKEHIYSSSFCTKKVRFIENPFFEQTGSAYSVSLALKASVPGDLLLILGDLYIPEGILELIDRTSGDVQVLNSKFMKSDEIGFIQENTQISHFSYSSQNKWGQILYMPEKYVSKLKKHLYNSLNSRLLMYEILNLLIEDNIKILPVFHNSYLADIDTPQDLLAVREYHEQNISVAKRRSAPKIK